MSIFDTFLNVRVFIETLPLILSGLMTTLLLGATCILLGFAGGMVLAMLRLYSPRIIRVYPMSRKWGSCSSLGTITLAIDLGAREPDFRDFVIAHELLHLRHPHHSRLFKAILTMHIPKWRALDMTR